jgi:hypothetical protein
MYREYINKNFRPFLKKILIQSGKQEENLLSFSLQSGGDYNLTLLWDKQLRKAELCLLYSRQGGVVNLDIVTLRGAVY